MSTRRVLVVVVEDNDQNRQLIEQILRMHQFEILAAATGEEGVALALSSAPDLVLMDIQLPGIDGREATRRIRADPSTEHVPVVAVTALAYPEDQQAALDAGCCDVVTKPFRMERLLSAMRDALQNEPGDATSSASDRHQPASV